MVVMVILICADDHGHYHGCYDFHVSNVSGALRGLGFVGYHFCHSAPKDS